TELLENVNVRAGDARMEHIAADRHDQALDAALAAADRERIEEGLGGVFMLAVPRIDDGAGDFLSEELGRARGRVAYNEYVGMHRVERHRGVEHRLALADRRGRDRHVEHIGAK